MKARDTVVSDRRGWPSPATWFSFARALLLAATAALGLSFVWLVGFLFALLFAELAVVGLACVGAGAVSLVSRRAAMIAAPFIWLLVSANTELIAVASLLQREEAPRSSERRPSSIALNRAPVLTLGGDLKPLVVAGGQPGQSCPEVNAAGMLSGVTDVDQYSAVLDPLQIARMVGAPTEIRYEEPDVAVSVVDAADPRQVVVRLTTSMGSRDFTFWRERRSSIESSDGPPRAFTPGKVLRWILTCNALRRYLSPGTTRTLPSPVDELAATVAQWTGRDYLGDASSRVLVNATIAALGVPEFERMPVARVRGWRPIGCSQLIKHRAWGRGTVVRDGKNGVVLSLDEELRVIACIDGADPVYVLDGGREPWEIRVLDRTATPIQIFRFARPATVKPSAQLEVESWMPEQTSLRVSVITTTENHTSPDNTIAASRQTFVVRLNAP